MPGLIECSCNSAAKNNSDRLDLSRPSPLLRSARGAININKKFYILERFSEVEKFSFSRRARKENNVFLRERSGETYKMSRNNPERSEG
jgi:hypothetical protein